jgi:hypothetical protein
MCHNTPENSSLQLILSLSCERYSLPTEQSSIVFPVRYELNLCYVVES